jgi:hypothetical protein
MTYEERAEKQVLHYVTCEEGAKRLYSIWSHRTGATVPFEHLRNEHIEAWRDIWRFVTDEPLCAGCGDVLLCLDCDKDAVEACQKGTIGQAIKP